MSDSQKSLPPNISAGSVFENFFERFQNFVKGFSLKKKPWKRFKVSK
jgi:hypothetical protein